ncbi:MAG TPA: DUF4236 domain-containing protein [Alphaproteobacteria bacterium]|nr:DUF4236 domain-containing protein [Alphaproteobacteria bacterium]HNS44772.1 DUF4236 domain-containing protein [Alphaproteobacteria bacterium]
MAFRFRKSIKVLPGVKLNIGKKGVSSLSVGGKGFTQNISAAGSKSTVGIPGTGISHTSKNGGRGGVLGAIILFILVMFFVASIL